MQSDTLQVGVTIHVWGFIMNDNVFANGIRCLLHFNVPFNATLPLTEKSLCIIQYCLMYYTHINLIYKCEIYRKHPQGLNAHT